MRKLIAAFRVSLDGYIEGPNGEVDWVDTWEDTFDLMPQIDALVLGGGMYPGYEQYWSAVHADPQNAAAFHRQARVRGRDRIRALRARHASCRPVQDTRNRVVEDDSDRP